MAETPPDRPAPGPAADAASPPLSADELVARLYAELRELARARMRRMAPGQTIQPTALIHEAYMKLVSGGDPGWDSPGHFFAAASRAMRNVLVDQARRRERLKRSPDGARLPLDDGLLPLEADEPGQVVALDAALTRLEAADARKGRIVVMRSFGGLTNEQIAASLGVSLTTVERDWRLARAWLKREIRDPRTSEHAR